MQREISIEWELKKPKATFWHKLQTTIDYLSETQNWPLSFEVVLKEVSKTDCKDVVEAVFEVKW